MNKHNVRQAINEFQVILIVSQHLVLFMLAQVIRYFLFPLDFGNRVASLGISAQHLLPDSFVDMLICV